MIDRAIPLRKSILGEKHGKFKLDRPIQVSSLIKVRLGQGVWNSFFFPSHPWSILRKGKGLPYHKQEVQYSLPSSSFFSVSPAFWFFLSNIGPSHFAKVNPVRKARRTAVTKTTTDIFQAADEITPLTLVAAARVRAARGWPETLAAARRTLTAGRLTPVNWTRNYSRARVPALTNGISPRAATIPHSILLSFSGSKELSERMRLGLCLTDTFSYRLPVSKQVSISRKLKATSGRQE